MSATADYTLPGGIVGLTGPVDKPAPGTLPLRGDLAHVALAGRYLAAHYVIPVRRTVGKDGAVMLMMPRDDAEEVTRLSAGTDVEILDYAGDWCWAACGPEGPSGYFHSSELIAE